MSDGERVKGVRSPSPKAGQSQEQTFVKDEPVEHTDHYIDDMKKGTSNILVIIIFSLTFRSPCGFGPSGNGSVSRTTSRSLRFLTRKSLY